MKPNAFDRALLSAFGEEYNGLPLLERLALQGDVQNIAEKEGQLSDVAAVTLRKRIRPASLGSYVACIAGPHRSK